MRSVAFKLWAGMMLLVIVVLVLLWFFQIVFLETFYIDKRIKEVTSRGASITQDINLIDRNELEDRLDSFTYDYNCGADLVDTAGDIVYRSGANNHMPMMVQNYLRAGLFNEILSGEIGRAHV